MAEARVELAFVCRRCNALSPMAASIADQTGGGEVRASCAGTDPEGRILPGALTALREIGVDTAELAPAPVQRASLEAADRVVVIGPGLVDDAMFEGLSADRWEIDNPEGGQLAAFRRARDELGLRVREILREEGLGPDDGSQDTPW